MVFPEKPGLTVPEADLVPYRGPSSFSTGTHVFENCLVRGSVLRLPRYSTAVVSFRNCKFEPTGEYALQADGGRLTVEHGLFDGGAYTAANGHPVVIDSGGTIRLSEFVHTTDNIRVGRNTTIEWNYIHSPMMRTACACSHADGIEVSYAARSDGAPAVGPHLLILNNYIDIGGAEGGTGAINVTNDFGPIDGVRIEGNSFLAGGAYPLYLRSDGFCGCGGDNRNVEVINNRWFASSTAAWGGNYGTHSWQPAVGLTTWSGNVLQRSDGTTVGIAPDDPKP